jgi:hypothetical protein
VLDRCVGGAVGLAVVAIVADHADPDHVTPVLPGSATRTANPGSTDQGGATR